MTEVNGWYLPGNDKYFVPFCEGELPKQNGFQREHLLAAFEWVHNWDVAIDVGAYVGFWTLDMAKRFEQVFAFEPARDSFECLCKNMADMPNVATAQAAVGEHSGRCNIIHPEPSKTGKMANTGSRYVDLAGKDVAMLALDDLKFAGCGLLKIDVEGFEPMVLRGAQRLIRRFRPVVIMETDKQEFRSRWGLIKHAAHMLLLQYGYKEVAHMRPDRIYVPDV